MQHFVALDINTPVTRALTQRQVRMVRERQAGAALAFIPFGFDHADLGMVDGPDRLERVVRRARDVDNDFVTQRQERENRRDERVAQIDAVANEGESADFHGGH